MTQALKVLKQHRNDLNKPSFWNTTTAPSNADTGLIMIKKFALAAVLALTAAPLAAHAYDLNAVVGVGMGDEAVEKNPVMQEVVAKAMSYLSPAQQEQVKSFLFNGVGSAINDINDVYYMNSCQPHMCSVNNIVIAAGQDAFGDKDTSVYVLLTLDGKTTVYGKPYPSILKIMKNPSDG